MGPSVRPNARFPALLLLLAAGCGGSGSEPASAPAPAVGVSVETVAETEWAGGLELSATVRPSRRAMPGTVLLGRVERVLHEPGDVVHRMRDKRLALVHRLVG